MQAQAKQIQQGLFMEIHPIARMLAEKGIESANLSMFPEQQKKDIYSQAADLLLFSGKFNEGIIALELAGRPLPEEQIKKIAETKMLLGQHREAYELLTKIGHKDMAEFIKANFF